MVLKSKRIRSAGFVEKLSFLFKCPVCASKMKVVEPASLKCEKGHSFDFAKQGYINLLPRPVKTKYGKELFEARRKLMADDRFFEPVIREIAKSALQLPAEPLYILDTGCGEGTHLNGICQMVEDRGKNTVCVGIDLAKEGILVAAGTYEGKIWCVADLADTPFMDETFNVILNILSPSNYAEFSRLLKPGGRLIKVVPKSGYLQELRTAFYADSEKETYSNEETVERFQEKFRLTDRKSIQYTKKLDRSSLEVLVAMTPLAWNADERKVAAFLQKTPKAITVDLEILIGEK